jgi:hypothetical protein
MLCNTVFHFCKKILNVIVDQYRPYNRKGAGESYRKVALEEVTSGA